MEHPNCPFFISSADVAGALRLQHQRTLPLFASGAGVIAQPSSQSNCCDVRAREIASNAEMP
jgi:hypothetical protein